VKHTVLFRLMAEKDGFLFFRRCEGMEFEEAYRQWMDNHLARRSGERLRRLREGPAYGEKLFLTNAWWPAVGHFDDLHPEYEVYDYRDGSRFLDHAFIRPPYRIDWETDAYGTHLRNIGRREYDDGLDRQNQLIHDGWKVYRFSVDALRDHPRKCQQFIQQVMGRLYSGGGHATAKALSLREREIVKMAARRKEPIAIADVCLLLHTGEKPARKMLKGLANRGILIPASGSLRITSYRLGPNAIQYLGD
jgi:hypothetical protein